MNTISPLLNVLNKSIRISGKKIIRDFSEIEILQSSVSKTEKFMNLAKVSLEKDVCEMLQKIKPDLKIKKYHDSNEENCWLIDLIDSPINFSRGVENFFINISLKQNDKIMASVIYNPVKDENYYFQLGLGGYKNNYRLRVSENRKISDSICSFFLRSKETKENLILEILRQVFKENEVETRESGSIYHDISLLVSGKIECLFFSDTNINIKNQICLILSETGGVVDELNIKKSRILIASNKYIGKMLKEMIKNKV